MTDHNETFSSEGPICPHCQRQYTADEAWYYDEMRLTEMECEECGKTFSVSVFTQTTWTCEPKDRPPALAKMQERKQA
jgi:Zn ribbon nucleic-acid-binding protein